MATKHSRERTGFLKYCFIIPMALMLLGYLCRGVFPLGDNSVLTLDLNAQYIYYFEAFRQAVYEGKSIFYSWSQSLSGEMIGIYGYYLSSPFTLIILLFPKEYITEAVLVMTVLKVGAAGLTFGYFLYKAKPMYNRYIVTLSVAYAMMSYVIVNAMNPMWLDAVIYLPIIILGIRRLADEGKYALYFASLALTIFANYYIGYMVCIFSLLYFIAYLIATDRLLGIKQRLKRATLFIGVSILAACAAAVIILPIYYSLTLGKMGFSAPNYDIYLRYDFLELLPKFLINSYDSVNVDGMPFIYCSSLALFLVPLYFMTPQIRMRSKICTAGLMFAVFAIMNISITEIAMHGFRTPNWLNYRYSFIASFLMLSAAADALKYIENNGYKRIFQVFGGLLVTVLVVQHLNIEYVKVFATLYVSVIVFGIYAIVLYCMSFGKNREFTAMLLLGCIMLEVFSNALMTFEDINQEIWYSSRSSYTDFMAESRPVVDSIIEADTGLYRMEKTYHRTVNDPMALKMNGISHSTSTLNADALRFLKNMGLSQRDHWSHYSHTTIATDALLGVKYVLSKTPMTPYYTRIDTQGEIIVYENPYVLPIMFVADEMYPERSVSASNPFEYQNKLINILLGEKNVEYFKRIEVENPKTENAYSKKSGFYDVYKRMDTSKVGKITYNLESVGGNPIYCYFAADYTNPCSLFVNGEFFSEYMGNETHCVMPLGEYLHGENLTVSLSVEEDDLYIRQSGAYFYYLDMDLFEKAVETLRVGGVNITKHTPTYIEGEFETSKKESTVFTSIPYEGGWTIKVDGVEVPYEKGADSLVTFRVSGIGEHTVTMKYVPPGLILGTVISVCAFALFFLCLKLSKQRHREREYALRLKAIRETKSDGEMPQ